MGARFKRGQKSREGAGSTLVASELFFSFRFPSHLHFGGGLDREGRVVAVEGGGAGAEDRRRRPLYKVTCFLSRKS
jgi:hypothetical protein